MRTSRALLAAAGAVVALTSAAPAAAASTAVACGDTLTGHVVLTADLTCSGPVGLELTDGTTLDLAGHRLARETAPGEPVPGEPLSSGIFMLPDAVVTVRGGVVSGWYVGITHEWENRTARRGHLTVEDVTLRDNDFGIRVVGLLGPAPDVDVVESRLVRNRAGISGLHAGVITVTSSQLVDNQGGAGASSGMTTVRVIDSVVARNAVGLGCGDGGACSLRGGTLRDNEVGLDVDREGSGAVVDATVVRNGTAFRCSYGGVHVQDSDVRDNGTGVSLSECGGDVNGTTFLRNDVGLTSNSNEDPGPNPWLRIEGNEFRRNGDGLVVRANLTAAVGGNTAVRNTGWGIHATGVVDLGGNTARGNGNEPQCVGVVCEGSGSTS